MTSTPSATPSTTARSRCAACRHATSCWSSRARCRRRRRASCSGPSAASCTSTSSSSWRDAGLRLGSPAPARPRARDRVVGPAGAVRAPRPGRGHPGRPRRRRAVRRSPSRPRPVRRRSRPCTTPGSCASWRRRGRSTSATSGRPTTSCPTCSPCPACAPGWASVTRAGACRRPARVVVLRDDDAADRGHLRRRPLGRRLRAGRDRRRARRRARRLRAVPAAGAPRHDVAVRRLLLLQQRGDRRRPRRRPRPAGRVAVLDVDYHHGNGTQQIFYERDDVAFVSLHGDPARAYPYHTGFADETGRRPGAWLDAATCRSPPAPTTTPTSPRSSRRWRRSRPSRPDRRRRVARASTPTSTTRCATSP